MQNSLYERSVPCSTQQVAARLAVAMTESDPKDRPALRNLMKIMPQVLICLPHQLFVLSELLLLPTLLWLSQGEHADMKQAEGRTWLPRAVQ